MTHLPQEIYDTLMHMQGVGDDRAVCVTLGALRALATQTSAPVVGEPVEYPCTCAGDNGDGTPTICGHCGGLRKPCVCTHPAPAPTACDRCAEAVDAANSLLEECANLRARLAAPVVCARCGFDGAKP